MWGAALVLVVAGLVYVNVMRMGISQEVTLAKAEEGEISESVFANGRIQPADETELYTNVDGKVKEVFVKVGDTVARGDVVMSYDTSDWERQIELERNRIEIEKLQRQIDRKRNYDAAKQGEKDAEQILALESDAQKLHELQIRGTENTIAQLREKIAQSVVKADSDGVVTKLNVTEGQTVPSGFMAAVFADVSSLKVSAALNELDAGKVQAGMKAIVTGDAFDDRLDGELTYIAPEAAPAGPESQDFQVGIEVTLAKGDLDIIPGLAAMIEFVLPGEKRVLVPIDAVVYRNQEAFVYKAEDGKAVQVAVKTGKDNGERVEILEGLKAGEEVISPLPEGLRDGKKVKAAQSE